MKYLKEYNSYNDIDDLCKEYGIKKWQDDYGIWKDGTLDEYRFKEMMLDK